MSASPCSAIEGDTTSTSKANTASTFASVSDTATFAPASIVLSSAALVASSLTSTPSSSHSTHFWLRPPPLGLCLKREKGEVEDCLAVLFLISAWTCARVASSRPLNQMFHSSLRREKVGLNSVLVKLFILK